MIRIWCEWDIGQERLIFKTREKAEAWLMGNVNLQEVIECSEGEFTSVNCVIDAGLIGFETLEVE